MFFVHQEHCPFEPLIWALAPNSALDSVAEVSEVISAAFKSKDSPSAGRTPVSIHWVPVPSRYSTLLAYGGRGTIYATLQQLAVTALPRRSMRQLTNTVLPAYPDDGSSYPDSQVQPDGAVNDVAVAGTASSISNW